MLVESITNHNGCFLNVQHHKCIKMTKMTHIFLCAFGTLKKGTRSTIIKIPVLILWNNFLN